MLHPVRSLLIAAVLALAGALGGLHLTATGLSWQVAAARACGIGPSATMLANTQPALSYPRTPQTPADAPLGTFALTYTANQVVTFTEDLSRLPTKVDPTTYQWQWDFGDGGQGSGFSLTHTYTQPGMYTVRVTLIDPSNAQNDDPHFDSAQIQVIPQPFDQLPVAMAHSTSDYVQDGDSATYDATGSHALVGGDLTYTWNFGDNTSATGPRVTHQFSLIGRGNVTLIVQDRRGARAVATTPVYVAFLPTATIRVTTTSAQTGDRIGFDASRSLPAQQVTGDVIDGYQWDFGDGTVQTADGPLIAHTYTHPGSYTVTLEVLDRQHLPGTTHLVIQVAASGTVSPWLIALIVALLVGAGIWFARRLTHDMQRYQRTEFVTHSPTKRDSKKRKARRRSS